MWIQSRLSTLRVCAIAMANRVLCNLFLIFFVLNLSHNLLIFSIFLKRRWLIWHIQHYRSITWSMLASCAAGNCLTTFPKWRTWRSPFAKAEAITCANHRPHGGSPKPCARLGASTSTVNSWAVPVIRIRNRDWLTRWSERLTNWRTNCRHSSKHWWEE